MLLRSILALLFVFLILARPGLSFELAVSFGMCAMIDGAYSLFVSIRSRRFPTRSWFLRFEGLAGACIGSVVLWSPSMAARRSILLVAGWSLATGALRVSAFIRARSLVAGEICLMLSGMAAVLSGTLALLAPPADDIRLLWLPAAYAFALGAFLIGMAIKDAERPNHSIWEFIE